MSPSVFVSSRIYKRRIYNYNFLENIPFAITKWATTCSKNVIFFTLLLKKKSSRTHWYQSHSHTHSNNRGMGCGVRAIFSDLSALIAHTGGVFWKFVILHLCTDGDSSALGINYSWTCARASLTSLQGYKKIRNTCIMGFCFVLRGLHY
jgi:hypothetical protein